MYNLEGKVAVVTGASKGIGAGIAKALAQAGAEVVVNYVSSREGADKVVADIQAGGGRAIPLQGDVSKSEDVKRLFQSTLDVFGHMDILVNNAGVYTFGPVETITPEAFRQHYEVNVLGPILAIQQSLKVFGEKGGCIINIGSGATTLRGANTALYAGTKGAIDVLTVVLSKELGPRNIRVNSINPGATETEGAHAAGAIGTEWQRELIASTPLGRFGQPEDVADVAVFLASDAARWITGELILVSGGLR